MQSKAEPAEAPLPAWRAELNEKVRAIKARRNGQSEDVSTPLIEPQFQLENERPAESRAIKRSDPVATARFSSSRDERAMAGETSRQPRTHPVATQSDSMQSRASQKTNDTIVEAALSRVRRATENASRASLPKIEPARTVQSPPKTSYKVDREATARALEPSTEIARKPIVATSPLPDHSPATVWEQEEAPLPKAGRVDLISRPQPDQIDDITESPYPAIDSDDEAPALPIDELEPLDYLEAEIRKVDKQLGREFARSERLPFTIHIAAGIVDLLTIAISAAPFLALIVITNGSFIESKTRTATALVFLVVSFFYLALTQLLCGRTFGMMLTNTRVLDSQTLEPPPPSRVLIRTAGYFIAAAPFLLGFLWALVNKKGRGWHDLISGTLVAREF